MTLTRKPRLAHFIAISVSLLTAGCALGPNFKKPTASTLPGYTPSPLSTTSDTTNVAGGEGHHFFEGHDIPGEWWSFLHSKALDALIERSLKANPDIKAAQAALLVARENVDTPQVSVSFVPDVFGLNRRTVESLRAQEQQVRFAMAATHITLSKNVAAGAIEETSVWAQIDATRALITINTNMREVLRTQYAKGYASRLEVGGKSLPCCRRC
jgi:outer membrane protein TolC